MGLPKVTGERSPTSSAVDPYHTGSTRLRVESVVKKVPRQETRDEKAPANRGSSIMLRRRARPNHVVKRGETVGQVPLRKYLTADLVASCTRRSGKKKPASSGAVSPVAPRKARGAT
jgi:hypothetical protein